MTTASTAQTAAAIMAAQTQDKLNQRLTPTWQEAGFNYPLAIVMECSEAIGHLNWEWWKKDTYQTPLIESKRQHLRLELVDILHFGMSLSLIEQDAELIGVRISDAFCKCSEWYYPGISDNGQEIIEPLNSIISTAITLHVFDYVSFARACIAAGMPFNALMAYYHGKAALNAFRWANGYGSTYIKKWKNRAGQVGEDNDFLFFILGAYIHDPNTVEMIAAGTFHEAITKALSDEYQLQLAMHDNTQ